MLTQQAMRQYVIDELRPENHKKIKQYLEETYGSAEMAGIYWVPLSTEVLTKTQLEHSDCQPFYFAVDLDQNRFALELLVRTKNRVRCACIGYASKAQRDWILDKMDSIFSQLNIAT